MHSELRPGMKSVQVVLRYVIQLHLVGWSSFGRFLHADMPFSSPRICYTDSIGVQEDQYPPNIAVKVNQSYCHVPVSVCQGRWS